MSTDRVHHVDMKEWEGNWQKIKSQISSKTSHGKKDSKKDAIKDITSDSQVNSYFPYRWSPANLTINIYFYLFLYLYITRITINNGTPHLKSLKSQNRRAALKSFRPLLGTTSLDRRWNDDILTLCAWYGLFWGGSISLQMVFYCFLSVCLKRQFDAMAEYTWCCYTSISAKQFIYLVLTHLYSKPQSCKRYIQNQLRHYLFVWLTYFACTAYC